MLGVAILVREVLADPRRAVYALVAAVLVLSWWVIKSTAERIGSRLAFYNGSITVSNVWEPQRSFKLEDVSGIRLCSIRDLWLRQPTILFLGRGGADCLGALRGIGWRAVDFVAIGNRLGLKVEGAFGQFVGAGELAGTFPGARSWMQRNPILGWSVRLGSVVALVAAVILVGSRLG
jgi:hypothetical protein